MPDVIVNAGLGVVAAVLAVVLMQAWPTRYRWSKTISLTRGQQSGRPIYRVRFGPRMRRPRNGSSPEARPFDPDRRTKRKGPIDVTIHARIAVRGLGVRKNSDFVVAIPVQKAWRPVAQGGVLTTLRPELCDPEELRYFPDVIKAKRANGTLSVQDLLELDRSELRLYAFGYRSYTGTRFMVRRFYNLDRIVPGVYDGDEVSRSADGEPPERPDLIYPADQDERVKSPARSIGLGRWRVEVRRVIGD